MVLDDPFFRRFFSRMPADTAATFTDAQLDAIKMVFGARTWGAHAIEVRKSFPFLWYRYYLVLLMGRENRSAERLEREGQPFGTIGNSLMTLFGLFIFSIPFWIVLYLIKNLVGLNVFYKGGVHDFMNTV